MTFLEQMDHALSKLNMMVQANFPLALRATLRDYGAELDRLRAEVTELRSKIEKGE